MDAVRGHFQEYHHNNSFTFIKKQFAIRTTILKGNRAKYIIKV